MQDSQAGQSDGVFGHRRYFSAPPCSSVFVSMAKLTPYDEQMNSLYEKPYHTFLSGHEEVTHPSTLRIVQGLGNRSDSSNRQHTRNDEIHEYAGTCLYVRVARISRIMDCEMLQAITIQSYINVYIKAHLNFWYFKSKFDHNSRYIHCKKTILVKDS